jgi:uncharacterized protein (TIGR03000 family)
MLSLRRLAAAGACAALALLASAAPGRAQTSVTPEIGQPSMTAGNPYYQVRPLVPYQTYGPRTPMSSAWGPGYTPIYMTTINTPGVYGRYVMTTTTLGFPEYRQPTFYPSVAYNEAGPTLTTTVAPRAGVSGLGEGATASLRVRVPADAELTFEGVRTSPVGTVRDFVTPPLELGRDYRYTVAARWMDAGREVRETRDVLVRAGDRLSIDLTTPEPTTLRTRPAPVPAPAPVPPAREPAPPPPAP